ncbi:NADH:ubiquinone oxidoreductase complex i intermediate-associated protein 30 [Sulfitobacter sp. SK011]|nr:NADH:ubiquinone oxidoreductase complex i intermediate-associated protein 30 [Sulfitobacter sp. SK011]
MIRLFISLLLATTLSIGAPVFAKDTALDLKPDWEFVADTVMGGVSTGQISTLNVAGRNATRLTGAVSLDNNGGFVQMAFDLLSDGTGFDASEHTGLEIEVFGNGEAYDLRLRTDALTRPWQSFRTEFVASPEWTTLRIPFSDITPHKTDATFDPAEVRRIGIVAIGREFEADVAVAAIRFYR